MKRVKCINISPIHYSNTYIDRNPLTIGRTYTAIIRDKIRTRVVCDDDHLAEYMSERFIEITELPINIKIL
jgi:hypothetical protein